MKILWLVSFRPKGKSKINDFYQSTFVESVKAINADITFSLTQFEEEGVENFINKKEIKCHYVNIPKSELPPNKKYSNKIMLNNAIDQFINKGDYSYLVYSTADIIVPNNLFEIISKNKSERFCNLIFPNTHVTDSKLKNIFWPHYGIDLIVFKINKEDAKKLKSIIQNYHQYDWGVIENFYISICELLNLKISNIFKFCNVIKFDNDFKAFVENRDWQIKSWKENQKYFLDFLNENNLSKLYAYGSYYYLLFKIFNFQDLNFKLLFSYIIFYPYNFIKKLRKFLLKPLNQKK